MEELSDQISSIQKKIERLNVFIALHLRRDRISQELTQLVTQTETVRDLLTQAHNLMQLEQNTLVEETRVMMAKMREKQTLLIEFLVKEKQRKLKADSEEVKKQPSICSSCGNISILKSAMKTPATMLKSSVKAVGFNLAQLHLQQQGGLTPKIKISEYLASPLVKKKLNPMPFQFTDFDVQITQQQFDKIPKYMCGRETIEQLNSFLSTVIISCFNEKYQLIHKARNALRNNEIELWKMFNDQASYIPGKMFITPGDVTRKVGKMLDKKAQNRLTILRHLGILQEQRIKQTVCLVWSYSGY